MALSVMVKPTFPDHDKLYDVAEALGISITDAAGKLLFLWLKAMSEECWTGEIDWTTRAIARAARWDGDPEKFVLALVNAGKPKKCGFLERKPDGGFILHDWAEHQGRIIGKLLDDRKRRAREREAKATSAAQSIPPAALPAPTDDFTFRMMKLMESQSIPGHPVAKREQIAAWASRVGKAKTEQIIMDPTSRGNTIMEIQRRWFDGAPQGKTKKDATKGKGIMEILKSQLAAKAQENR